MTRKTLPVALIQEQQPRRCRGQPGRDRSARGRGRRSAARKLVLLQELHNGAYFCQHESVDEFDLAEPIPGPTSEAWAAGEAQRGPRRLAFRAPRGRHVSQHRGGLR